jgi:hypothetical protein
MGVPYVGACDSTMALSSPQTLTDVTIRNHVRGKRRPAGNTDIAPSSGYNNTKQKANKQISLIFGAFTAITMRNAVIWGKTTPYRSL